MDEKRPKCDIEETPYRENHQKEWSEVVKHFCEKVPP